MKEIVAVAVKLTPEASPVKRNLTKIKIHLLFCNPEVLCAPADKSIRNIAAALSGVVKKGI